MTKKEFGQWLKTTRSSLAMSQDQLAKSLGFVKQEIDLIEKGITAFPKDKIKALSLVLKVEKKFILELKVIFKDAA